MSTLHFGDPAALSYTTLVHTFPPWTFAKPTRSTVRLLAWWRDHDARLSWLLDGLKAKATPEARLSFEYSVASVGRAKPSFTDVMFCQPGLAVGIEAKWTEGRSETVRRWLESGKSARFRREVLGHWLAHVNAFRSSGKVAEADVLDLPYQAVHRTASACCTGAGGRAIVLYQRFTGSEDCEVRQRLHDDVGEDLAALAAVVRPAPRLEFWLLSVPTTCTPAFKKLSAAVERATASATAIAYACEALSRVLVLGRNRDDREGLVEEIARGRPPNDETVDPREYVEILREAVAARNGWRRILARCAPRQDPRLAAVRLRPR